MHGRRSGHRRLSVGLGLAGVLSEDGRDQGDENDIFLWLCSSQYRLKTVQQPRPLAEDGPQKGSIDNLLLTLLSFYPTF